MKHLSLLRESEQLEEDNLLPHSAHTAVPIQHYMDVTHSDVQPVDKLCQLHNTYQQDIIIRISPMVDSDIFNVTCAILH